ncbi:hypothetical protein JS756_13610 [Streptomyces actuosus]|uniref:Uncharacterized protein n=1 Tax=Streptomyces actuosus TaxID=1885 RepID=A0ABS2VPT9_STRAS|nr:hypothetical protein [Streptomyces actuosus]MBN0045129.1 hypothetical protein [Streptomyces actuosus]
MIKQVSHTVPGTDPAGITLALKVARDLHTPTGSAGSTSPAASAAPTAPAPPTAPAAQPRPTEIAGFVPAALRSAAAARTHRRKVPLKRPTAVRG